MLHADPHRLIVAVPTRVGRLRFAVLHGPDASYEDQVPWWRETARLLEVLRRSLPTFLLADTNAKVGTVTSTAIGPEGAEEQCEAGAALHELLIAQSPWLPTTFRGGGATWRNNAGKLLRPDGGRSRRRG